jgi:hypothetical protein
MRTWITIAVCAATTAAATSAHGQISAALAKQCRAMMVKAYPLTTYGTAVSAAAQREYFQDCIKRQGKMDDSSQPATTEDRHRPY